MNTPIDKLFENFENLKAHLLCNKELDYFNIVENDFRKNLLISSASFLETNIQNIIIDFVDTNSNMKAILHFLKNKAIKRQYHTYFEWDGKNINSFLGLFGAEFSDKFKELIKAKSMESKVKSFLELGKLRNQLIHQNFIIYTLEKTSPEIKFLFDEANIFVNFFETELKALTNVQ